jgi:hypothetical protein
LDAIIAPVDRTRTPVPPGDLAEAARMLRAVVEAVPAETALERAVARHALAGALVLSAASERLERVQSGRAS